MLIRFQIKNLYSFEEETEFNLLTNDSELLPHHKKHANGVDFLRMTAIYGANASGKSNFVKAIALLQESVKRGKIIDNPNDCKFKLSEEALTKPISLGIELLSNSKMYYYTLTFEHNQILNEALIETFKEGEDRVVFERSLVEGIQQIPFVGGNVKDEKERIFLELLSEKLLSKEELLLTFLAQKYPNEYADINNVVSWFSKTLIVLTSNFKTRGITHYFDVNENVRLFIHNYLSNLSAGIENVFIETNRIEETFPNINDKTKKEFINKLKKESDKGIAFYDEYTREEVAIVLNEDDTLSTKRLFTEHLGRNGYKERFPLRLESDGTKRLLEYAPLISDVINNERVYIVDEIERSIHPMMIKELIKKISSDTTAKGQLIFTTHESCLLDQEILRPDEIWFTQKDMGGATQMYSLSDFNISNTATVENDYLNGRYGGIPFLSNLKELNWHTDDIPNQK
ncbi:ATP-binding protein [Capnocytophaga leadbetteri]|uniref:AAA family ATPase n=1 Tax=Capnocytophaga leadbetteri TaxID=327575 RepID=UPI0028F14C1A|nr:ATP-binding protein [Capnocytophaga leadbetteri]